MGDAVRCNWNLVSTLSSPSAAARSAVMGGMSDGFLASLFSMWFWSRADIPASITSATSNTIDISQWGPPSAAFPVTNRCELTQFFTPQQLVFDIALCGHW